MKKTLSLVLALILSVFCLASCGGESIDVNNAYDLYANAMKAAENGMEVKMTMNVAGVDTVTNLKLGKDACEITTTVEGMESAIIFVDGVMYMEMDLGALGGVQKIKQELSFEEFMEENSSGTDMPDLTKEMLKDIKVETVDGKKSFTIDLTSQSGLVESMLGKEYADANLGSASLTCNFSAKGVMTGYSLNCFITVMGQSMELDIQMEITSIGKQPTISAPEDADSYKDLSSLGGLLG